MSSTTQRDMPARRPDLAAAPASASLADRLREWRNRLISNPKTQALAKRLPFTRPIARKKSAQLFDLVAGFVYSQTLLACVELDLFQRLSSGPSTVEDLADACELPREGMARLVAAATAIGLLEKRGADGVGLGELGAVIAATPGIAAMVAHHRLLYADLADPVGLLRGDRGPEGTTQIQRFWSYATAHDPAATDAATAADYSDLMAISQAMIASEVLDAYPIGQHNAILDIGGGSAAFAIAVAQRVPGPRMAVFDLPNVAPRARANIERAGLSGRIEVHGGDFFRDPFPPGADLITLVRVCYDHDDDKVARILGKAREALAAGGRLLIAEPMAGVRGAERVGDAYFGFYLLAMGSGRPRSPETFRRMLTDAGFSRIELRATHMPVQTSVIAAHR